MKELTASQREFIESDDKFIRLLAPAGCGKTFSIIEKARATLVRYPRAKINVFTFTRGAADEIRERCDNAVQITVNTLNAWGNAYIKSVGLTNPRIVASASERKWCVLNSLQSVWAEPEYERFGNMFSGRGKVSYSEKMLEMMDLFKNIGFVHTKVTKNFAVDKTMYDNHLAFIETVGLGRYYDTIVDELMRVFGKDYDKEDQHEFVVSVWLPFWRDCCDKMIRSGIYTLDDQKYIANIKLMDKIARGEKWTGSAKMDYIIIDEFQDISPLDSMLISNLQYLNDSALIIVGDDDQAIYEFRGATPYFIVNPDEIFGHRFTSIVLDTNFRSPANIVEKSMQLIQNNVKRVPKTVLPGATDLAKAEIDLRCYDSQTEMINAVIEDIRQSVQVAGERVVVLSRLKASLLPYQILLTKESIPYTVSDDLAFFLTGAADKLNTAMAIKRDGGRLTRDDLLAMVCLASKNEIYDNPRATLRRFFVMVDARSDNIGDVLASAATSYPKLYKSLFTADFIRNFADAMACFMKTSTVYDTLQCLLTRFDGLKQNYNRSLEDLYYRDPPLISLLDFGSQYGSDYAAFIDDFTTAIEKARVMDDAAMKAMNIEPPRVFLSTALRVKGQQFDKVIVLNVDDGTWPKSQAKGNEDAYEAERRLFYVAATRSKKSLHLYRSRHYQGYATVVSPFIDEGGYDRS